MFKILSIKQFGYIPPPFGGVSVHIYRLVKRLNDNGYYSSAYFDHKPEILNEKFEEYFTSLPDLHIKKIFKSLPKLLKEFKKYDIIHSHFSLDNMLFLWLTLILLRKKIVVTIHNSMVIEYYKKEMNAHNKIFLKLVCRNKNVNWIAVSEQCKENLKYLPVSFKNLTVIPAYIPLVFSENDYKTFPSDLLNFLNQNKRVITFYGHNYALYKNDFIYGYEYALQMFSEICKIFPEFVMVMCIPEDKDSCISKKLYELAKKLEIESKIFWQTKPIYDMAVLWKNTSVYIRPTATDGDSIAVREALSFGVPVVASDVCNRPEGTIVYKYSDNRDFVDKVWSIINSKHIRNTNYDFQYYNQIIELYKTLHKL